MSNRTIQRFYSAATLTPVREGFAVLLDERPVKTPHQRVDLVVPSAPLAEAVAEEWAAQEEVVRPETMPLTALACTALDVAGPQRVSLIAGIAKYAETDLVCYRVPEPQALAERQHALWQPLLDWAALLYDARLNVTTGILPVEQPPDAVRALHNALEELDAMRLAATSVAVRAAGSLVIALALVAGRIDGRQAFDAAEVEGTFQIEEWGEDEEAARRRAALKAELEATERFLRLLT